MDQFLRCFDLFCGGGGSSRGATMAGATVVGGVDAWKCAADTFRLNFPGAEVFNERAEAPDPAVIAEKVGKVDLLLASPECTSHSIAKGNAPRCESSRNTAFEVTRYARVLKPRWIVVENVPRMRRWGRFQEWLKGVEALGYKTTMDVVDSKDFGAPQSRRRLIVVCDLERQPSLPRKNRGRKKCVASVLTKGASRGKPWSFSPLRSENRAAATLLRAERAIKALGTRSEFILVYYGTDGAGGYQAIDRPLRTITTLDRFAYVRPTRLGHEMRMLQPPELAAAMGFPETHRWPECTRREKIKLIGNAVCPPVMCAVVRHLTSDQPPETSARPK